MSKLKEKANFNIVAANVLIQKNLYAPSVQYIKSYLEETCSLFPSISFRYRFNGNTKTHIVEVRPLSDFQDNEDYACREAEFMFDFEHRFGPETILFVSDESLTKVNDPEFEVGGKKIRTFKKKSRRTRIEYA